MMISSSTPAAARHCLRLQSQLVKRAAAGASACQSLQPQARFLSSSQQQEEQQLVQLPPNLKFDERSTVHPFYGLEPVNLNQQQQEEEVDGIAEVEEDSGYDSDASEYESEEEEELWYDLSEADSAPLQVIPLPDRLHVNILDKDDPLNPIVGTIYLDKRVFGHDPIRVDLLQRSVQYQRNKKRGKRFAAKTKTISEVSGSGKKVRQQKGLGMARAGHKRPAHWRGGAKAHGPKGKIQDYTTKLNKKVRKLALQHAASQKLLEQNLMLVSDLHLATHKTLELSKMLQSLDINIGGRHGKSALLVDAATVDNDDNNEQPMYNGLPVHLTVAASNLPKVTVLHPNYANVYDMLKHEKLVLTLSGLQALEERLVVR